MWGLIALCLLATGAVGLILRMGTSELTVDRLSTAPYPADPTHGPVVAPPAAPTEKGDDQSKKEEAARNAVTEPAPGRKPPAPARNAPADSPQSASLGPAPQKPEPARSSDSSTSTSSDSPGSTGSGSQPAPSQAASADQQDNPVPMSISEVPSSGPGDQPNSTVDSPTSDPITHPAPVQRPSDDGAVSSRRPRKDDDCATGDFLAQLSCKIAAEYDDRWRKPSR